MLYTVGIDRGKGGDREVSVNLFNGSPNLGSTSPNTGQYISLPSSGLTFRHLFLPKASKAIRQQVITEELSYSLPFPLAEAHYGSVEKGEEAWVTIASDAVVKPVQDLYPKAHLEAEPLCYLRAAKAAGIQQALVVDFGASKTVFCGIENGGVGTVRVLLRGGDTLTEKLSDELGISLHDAEILKRDEGTEHPTIKRFFQELLEEALLPSPFPYQRVLICGGGSACQGLLGLLTKTWGKDVDAEPFPLPGRLMPTDHVVAYGAALAGRIKATRLQMNHSFHQVTGSTSPLHLTPLFFTVLLMGLMVFGLETRFSSASAQKQELRGDINEALKPFLEKASAIDENQIMKQLHAQLEEQRESSTGSPTRVMNTLGRTSKAITAKKDAQVFSVIYEDQILKLEGRASSLNQSEDIRRTLEDVLVDVEQVKTRPNSDSTFTFQIEGKLPES